MENFDPLDEILGTVCREMQVHPGHGRVADYIPALARVGPRHSGIAVDPGGNGDVKLLSAGDDRRSRHCPYTSIS